MRCVQISRYFCCEWNLISNYFSSKQSFSSSFVWGCFSSDFEPSLMIFAYKHFYSRWSGCRPIYKRNEFFRLVSMREINESNSPNMYRSYIYRNQVEAEMDARSNRPYRKYPNLYCIRHCCFLIYMINRSKYYL